MIKEVTVNFTPINQHYIDNKNRWLRKLHLSHHIYMILIPLDFYNSKNPKELNKVHRGKNFSFRIWMHAPSRIWKNGRVAKLKTSRNCLTFSFPSAFSSPSWFTRSAARNPLHPNKNSCFERLNSTFEFASGFPIESLKTIFCVVFLSWIFDILLLFKLKKMQSATSTQSVGVLNPPRK